MTIAAPPSAVDVKIDNTRLAIDAVEDRLVEIREHLSRIQDETHQALAEVFSCYDCGDERVGSLMEALKEGWLDFTHDGESVTGWCPPCIQKHEEAERKLNEPCIPKEKSTEPSSKPQSSRGARETPAVAVAESQKPGEPKQKPKDRLFD